MTNPEQATRPTIADRALAVVGIAAAVAVAVLGWALYVWLTEGGWAWA